jgi:hypothetical protein
MLLAPGVELPPQGWKVHVSATLDNAAEVLAAVREYCLPRGISFKFLTDRIALLLRNAKYADRGGSGKFVTIYPVDPDELHCLLRELGEALTGFVGPYILSDARWSDGPLHIRYGGFTERFCTLPDGTLTPAVAEPDGNLVPDVRRAEFVVPSWVEVPDFLAACVKARTNPDTPHDLPFRVVRPLHFSNGGGVYLATDERTGREVVLKEARPFAGVDSAGADAVQRLRRERDFLRELAHTGVVPAVYDYLVVWEHHFLVEEYVDGEVLGREFLRRCPLIGPETDETEVAEYTRWALDVLDRVDEALQALHGAGIAFGDLHPYNVVIRPDGRVTFIDMEVASAVADQVAAKMGAPGFVSPDSRVGAEADRYAMACLRLHLFLPLTIMLPLHPAKAVALAGAVVRRFPVPASFATQVVEVLRDRRPAHHTRGPLAAAPTVAALADRTAAGDLDWPALSRSLQAAILASATPERADRLFPGDIEQFTSNGVGFAHGAAGVLHVLARTGAGRFPEHERWLLDAVRRGAHNGKPGFYDGLHGIAYVLAGLDRVDDALTVLDRAVAAGLDDMPHTLFAGLSGAGLNLLHFAELTGNTSLTALAVEAGGRLVEQLAHTEGARGRAGLMHGLSGQALLLVTLYRTTGDQSFLDAAETALRHDLDRCVLVADGSMQVDEGWRTMPYVATGSLGVGWVLANFLRHRENPEFATALEHIHRAAEAEFVICSGLFNGRAGLIDFLVDAVDPTRPAVVQRHLRRLSWHMLPYRGQVAFPGDQLMRLSMDVATGSAGVLAAMSAALDGTGPVLPFLDPVSQTTNQGHGPGRMMHREGGDLHDAPAEPPGNGVRRRIGTERRLQHPEHAEHHHVP